MRQSRFGFGERNHPPTDGGHRLVKRRIQSLDKGRIDLPALLGPAGFRHRTARHPDAEQPLKAWFKVTGQADWATLAAVKAAYGSAGILENNRVCFNIAGNKYRLIVKINYPYRVIYIRFVGTHGDYDKVDANSV